MNIDRSVACARTLAIAIVALVLAASHAHAQANANPSLVYIPGSSVKLEQVIGDCDWAVKATSGTCLPTASQTVTRFNILGNGFGYSFEDNGKLLFLFGDTISNNASVVNYHAHDPIASSTGTDPESGLLVNFYTNTDGSPLFMEPPGIAMGADDICNSGITLPDGVYLVCNTNADESLADPHQNAYSVLVRFDEANKTFTAGRTISHAAGGHFVFTSVHALGTDVFMFGMGQYRASDIYLSRTPASGFWSGTGTRYFAGMVEGQPTWTSAESGAVPVVQDNPGGGPAWPNDTPSVGNVSVAYSTDLGLWLMTYDGGRQAAKTTGAYFAYASQPWGPWSTPQLIFNANRDNGRGVFIHDPSVVPDPPGDGLNGPVIGSNDPYTTPGGDFAPLMIERFTRVSGNTLKIYYMMSTWNPYTVVKMRSEFQVAAANYEGLWWKSPAGSESGWGVNIAHQGDILFATWFTYDADGNGMWLVMSDGAKTGAGTYSGTLYRTTGPAFSANPWNPAQVGVSPVGSANFAFSDANDGMFTYTVNGLTQSKAIVRQVYSTPVPTCVAGGTQGNPPNYQDLWWRSPAGSESGWGVNITHQGDTLFATWFTYDSGGKGMWLVMSDGAKTGPGKYAGTLYRTTGPAFSANPWNPALVTVSPVGTATFNFSDSDNGTFAYTVNGISQSKSIIRQVYSAPATACQ